MPIIQFTVKYHYATEGIDSEKSYHLGNVSTVTPTILRPAVMAMLIGDQLEYTSSEGLYTVTIKCEQWEPQS